MALAALISACRTVDDGSERLRATLPLAGGTLLEHQVRLAVRAGADHVVILAERQPPALTAAIDRLKRDGIAADLATGPADAADRFHPETALLVIADGCLAGGGIVTRMAGQRAPAILTVPDHGDFSAHERIDAAARWGGLLLIDSIRLRRTVDMLGDWDLESTLLRMTVQEGAQRVPARGETKGLASTRDMLLIVEDGADVIGLDRAMIAESRAGGTDWPARLLFPWIEQAAVPPLLARGIDPVWLSAAALALAIAAVPILLIGWPRTGFALLLASGPVAAVAARMAATQMARLRYARSVAIGRALMGTLALIALAWAIAPAEGWGVWLLAAATPLFAGMAADARRILARLPGGAPLAWIASLDGLLWAMLPFAVAGWWLAGLGVLAAYALASAIALQREAAKRVAHFPAT
jgi:hypothetical protein